MNKFNLTNIDTDSISFCKQDFSPFNKSEIKDLIKDLNKNFTGLIEFADDGYFPVFIVLKSKNYIMVDEKGNRKIKGSALKSSTLEPILRTMLNEMIDCLVEDRQQDLQTVYSKYLSLAENITDIKPWCSKKQLSPTTYNSTRKNETDIIDALKGSEYKSGDRVYLFTKSKVIETGEYYKVGAKKGQPKTKEVKELCLYERFAGDYSKEHYKDRVYKTATRFESVLGKGFFQAP